ncbi:hypothetical protein HDU96_005485 [Phlyctochytrium bullatum]|nr:hypothetical protein HDU96_005485 [Phlyctochytrium bullatum]
MSGAQPEALEQILNLLANLKSDQKAILNKVEAYQKENKDAIANIQERMMLQSAAEAGLVPMDRPAKQKYRYKVYANDNPDDSDSDVESVSSSNRAKSPMPQAGSFGSGILSVSPHARSVSSSLAPLYNHRIVLTTYPGQVGINPIPLNWGHPDPEIRGPIVASRNPSSIKVRNAIGAHGGSYSVYRALAIAIRELEPTHRPNLHNTQPVVKIGPHPSWGDPNKIVSMDPWGHAIAEVYAKSLHDGIDIRPTIAITKAHMKLIEIESIVKAGQLKVDGKIVVNEAGDLMVTKGAVEPVWYLPGSDVFGSDICTCRPYLIYGIEECVKTAQEGGVGLIVYFRKEGRALGEVTKYLVYNARKRAEGGDTAENYFLRTENVAGVKDMRFQATMPDVLHWLGIKKIDKMISMSNMKYDAIVGSGIPILTRVPIPEERLPPDSQVEIDAKIASGYFSNTKPAAALDLANTKGRTWDDINH